MQAVKPVILAVDDEVRVLNSVARDLLAGYGEDYQILKAHSGQEALDVVKELKKRDRAIALFLVDQRMPGMTGIEFLNEAMHYYPEAKKVMLTAYSDTEAAIASINQVGLDYYLLKPWDPPEVHLYPVLTDLLHDWAQGVEITYPGIRVAGTLWSARCHAVKDFLARNLVPYQWLDIEKDQEAARLVHDVTGEKLELPVVFFPDGETLVNPELRALAEKLGLHARPAQPFYDLIIIGAGPAGLAAAVYAASEGLRTLIVEKEATGGQAGGSSRIENYLGFPRGLSGADLARRATIQARRFGAEILTSAEATAVRAEQNYRYVRSSDGDELACHALLVATGVTVSRLQAPGVERLTGAGVYYGAAVSEAAYYRGQEVTVLGGGNSAGQAVLFLSNYASKVHLVVRSSQLGAAMSQYLVDLIEAIPNVEVVLRHEAIEAVGEQRLECLKLRSRDSGEVRELPCSALFIFIGSVPHTELVQGLVLRDSAGYILTGPDLLKNGSRPPDWTLKRDPYLLETSCPGIFAAGDVRRGSVKRIGSAVGEGAVCVALVHQYLRTV